MALIAFLMTLLEEYLLTIKGQVFQYLLQSNGPGGLQLTTIAFYVVFSMLLAGSAAILTVYLAPQAAGSGIPELIGFLNGVATNEKYFKPLVFIVKAIGVTLAVAGTLIVGREGPLAHIGAGVATFVLFMPLKYLEQFRYETKRREFIAAGISAGVSVAFGAPMGGALFAYEISSPSTFWTFKLLWRNFFCSSIATFFLAVFVAIYRQEPLNLTSSSVLKFGIVAPSPD